jgi:hypothetical protein
MSWIKRNLFFVIGGAIAVVLLGLAGFYCFSKWNQNQANLQKLTESYGRLEAIRNEKPNPGNGTVDNIKLAKEQQQQVRQVIEQMQKYFVPVRPVIESTNLLDDEHFSDALRLTLKQLTENAANSGVMLATPKYTFSFEVQVSKGRFERATLPLLSQQLAEVRTICGILYGSRINTLQGVRRERVSSDDANGLATDYLDAKSVTNDLAILTPYEVRFTCFSGELGKVLAAFAGDSHGFIVKLVNVEPDVPVAGGTGAAEPAPTPGRGLPVVLDEKQLRVTMALNIVKLLPKK